MKFPIAQSTAAVLFVAVGVLLVAVAAASAQFAPIPNAQFSEGDDVPAGWTLSGGNGQWVDRQILEVTGSGEDSNFWRCDYRFTPGRLYRFSATGRGTPSQGSAIVGPVFANRDYRAPSPDWMQMDYTFRVPENVTESYFRLGQWHANGPIQFDKVALTPVLAVHQEVDGLMLGDGESIRDGRYTFSGTFNHEGSNYHRTLHRATATFNSDRWCFGQNSEVVYRFDLAGRRFVPDELNCNVNYHTAGGCQLEVSRDGRDWRPLATRSEVGTLQASLDEAEPAEVLFVRLRSLPGACGFQINRVECTATIADDAPDVVGQTVFAEVTPGESRQIRIERITMRNNSDGRIDLRVTAVNTGRSITLRATASDDRSTEAQTTEAVVARGQVQHFDLTLPAGKVGKRLVKVTVGTGTNKPATARLTLSIPDFYRTDYGRRIASIRGDTAVWFCDATHKIAPRRVAPELTAPAATLSAAKNDFEAVQIVVRPDKPLTGLRATAGKLTGPGGATIPAKNIKILRVAYHFVHHPTDKTGVSDFWPDALPPLDKPVDVPAGENQPLWVLVRVPADAKPGDYSGKIFLAANDYLAEVPLSLHVWDFALPEKNHIETAFGFSPGSVFRYHGLKTEADKRRVLDMYLQSFSDHRISPYNPTPMDRIGVRFLPDADPPRAELDFAAFDKAMARAVDRLHFTGIRLPVEGMGGGTFHARYAPSIKDFGEDTPQFKAMFASYVKQLEEHLREKGWLEHAYIYWFDEPDPKDYEFVADGFRRLRQYAPGLRRMLTEQPGDNVLTGLVNIWCPVSFNYDHQKAEARRAAGERFWWYVCTGPKEPYCTLFIDHPATELRTWLWQSWQRNVTGVLVWQSNYWTSSAAFPDVPQNPYEDPMGYVSGYSTPKGTKRHWGNGDGRFIYPPEAAAVPGQAGSKPVIAPPVSSIRWEMLREGIEDWEMLYLLRELLAKHKGKLSPEAAKRYELLLEVPESITKDMTTFTTDPTPIYARRAEVAEAIERLSR